MTSCSDASLPVDYDKDQTHYYRLSSNLTQTDPRDQAHQWYTADMQYLQTLPS